MKINNCIFSVFILPLLMLTMQQCENNLPKPKELTELEKLPPATQSGKRTFGCLVDGKAWVTKLTTHSQAYYQTGTLGVFASVLNEDFYSNISFYVSDLNLTEKTYQFTEKVFQSGGYAQYYDFRSHCEYTTTIEINGTVTITHLDKINYIISGTFEFEAYSSDCNKVIKITDGRFDIHYAALIQSYYENLTQHFLYLHSSSSYAHAATV